MAACVCEVPVVGCEESANGLEGDDFLEEGVLAVAGGAVPGEVGEGRVAAERC